MQRLTAYTNVGGVRIGDLKVDVPELQAFDKLAAYEDSGLTPEEAKERNQHTKFISVDSSDCGEEWECTNCHNSLWLGSGPQEHGMEFCPWCGRRLIDEREEDNQ